MRISVELVPRNEAALLEDAATARAAMPEATAFNIPDLMRFPLRSWDACRLTRPLMAASIPHIRAIDIPRAGELPMLEAIRAAGLREVLVVKGDPPHDLAHRTYPNTSEDIIRRFKRQMPELRVYAAFDPYRRSFREELDAVSRKVDAGADGFFTQPLFDLRLLEMCGEMMQGHQVFWGIAPVMGDRSRAYWETTNRVVFPAGFRAEMDWNRDFARKALERIRAMGGDVYFMPIKVKLKDYLGGLL